MSEHHSHPTYAQYIMIFAALAILTALTVAISYTSLGHGVKLFLAFGIASVKVFLVGLIFMHLRFETRTIIIFALSPLVLAIIFMLAISPDIGIAG